MDLEESRNRLNPSIAYYPLEFLLNVAKLQPPSSVPRRYPSAPTHPNVAKGLLLRHSKPLKSFPQNNKGRTVKFSLQSKLPLNQQILLILFHLLPPAFLPILPPIMRGSIVAPEVIMNFKFNFLSAFQSAGCGNILYRNVERKHCFR